MRSIWKGSINFGLVNIPVEMYNASREREFKFVLLHDADHSPIRYARICKEEGQEVAWSHVVRGYESPKGHYIIMDDEDFKKALSEHTDYIDIKQFTDEDNVDSRYFEKPYYLEPKKGATKSYTLLVAALKKAKKAAIATYVIHNREHVGLIKAQGDILLLNQMRFDNEILSADELTIPKAKGITTKEVDMAIKLIEEMDASFKPEDYKDTYTEALRKIIKRKAKGQKIVAPPAKKAEMAEVIDLMSALKASLKTKGKKQAS